MAIQEANGMRLSHSAQEVDDAIDAVDAIDAKIGGDYSSTSTVAIAIADAKKAGTDASSALATYKTSNDAAVANAKKAGTDASAHADALNTAIDKRVTALEGKEDKDTTYTFTDDTATDSSGMVQTVTVTKVNGHSVETNVPADAKFTDTVYDDTAIKAEISKKSNAATVVQTSLSSGGWSGGKYSFETQYPTNKYDITVEPDGDKITAEGYEAWGALKPTGSMSNVLIAKGKIPAVDIAVILRVVEKNA